MINRNDLYALKRDLFENSTMEEWSKWISTSWSGMFIFEIDKENNCINFESTPIRAHYLTYILEDIRDKGEFEIKAICTWEEGNDWLEVYDGDLKRNHSATCIYLLDEVKVVFSKIDNNKRLPKSFNKLNETTFEYKKVCGYHAHCRVNEKENSPRNNSLQNRCKFLERDNFILNNCTKQIPESNWYSDSEVLNFMHSFERGDFQDIIERVEFLYRNKLVRLYDCGQFDECYMLENWFNLDTKTYDNLKVY